MNPNNKKKKKENKRKQKNKRSTYLQIGELDGGQVVLVRAQVQPHLVEQLELLHSGGGACLRSPLRNLFRVKRDYFKNACIRNGGLGETEVKKLAAFIL